MGRKDVDAPLFGNGEISVVPKKIPGTDRYGMQQTHCVFFGDDTCHAQPSAEATAGLGSS